jgi:hypothetical protein
MKAILDFLSEVIQLLSLQSTVGGKKDEEVTEDAKDAYQWLMNEIKNTKSNRVQEYKDPWMQPGKIYVFRYNAKYKKELDYWDRHPIVLVLGNLQTATGKVTLGLNISWYPPSARKYIVERIRNMYKPSYQDAIKSKSFKAVEQRPVLMDVYALKTALDALGLSFAMRTYIPSNIVGSKYCICYEDWDKAIKLDQPRIFPELEVNSPGYSLSNIYEDFKKYVQWQSQNSGERKVRMDNAKKNNRYRLVK